MTGPHLRICLPNARRMGRMAALLGLLIAWVALPLHLFILPASADPEEEAAADYVETAWEEEIEAPAVVAIPLHRQEAGMLEAINARRQEAGLPPVFPDDRLTDIARLRSQDMAARNYFSHTTPEGTTAISLLKGLGLPYTVAGEILGRTNGPEDQSVDLIISGFLNSPRHRNQVLNPRYTEAGLGYAIGPGNMRYYAILFLAE